MSYLEKNLSHMEEEEKEKKRKMTGVFFFFLRRNNDQIDERYDGGNGNLDCIDK